jgi:uncharacterized membrane protein
MGASALRSGGLLVQDMWRLQEFLGGDRATHFLMGGAFMLAGFLVVLPRSVCRTLWLALIVVALLFVEEVSQLAMATREFNWMDFGMGAAGALLMLVILSSLHFLSLPFLETKINIKDDLQR